MLIIYQYEKLNHREIMKNTYIYSKESGVLNSTNIKFTSGFNNIYNQKSKREWVVDRS